MKKSLFMVALALCLPFFFAFTPFNSSEHDVSPEEFELRQEVLELKEELAEKSTLIEKYRRDVSKYRIARNRTLQVFTSADIEMAQFRLCMKACSDDYKDELADCGSNGIPTTTGPEPMSDCEIDALADWMTCSLDCAN